MSRNHSDGATSPYLGVQRGGVNKRTAPYHVSTISSGASASGSSSGSRYSASRPTASFSSYSPLPPQRPCGRSPEDSRALGDMVWDNYLDPRARLRTDFLVSGHFRDVVSSYVDEVLLKKLPRVTQLDKEEFNQKYKVCTVHLYDLALLSMADLLDVIEELILRSAFRGMFYGRMGHSINHPGHNERMLLLMKTVNRHHCGWMLPDLVHEDVSFAEESFNRIRSLNVLHDTYGHRMRDAARREKDPDVRVVLCDLLCR